MRSLGLTLILLILSSCSSYQVSVNERVVYEPPALFTNYDVSDIALKACIKSVIEEQSISKAGQLKQLICPPGEIRSLLGLEVFEKLETLGLGANQIESVGVVGLISTLRSVNLADNQIDDIRPLSALTSLELLNIKGNAALNCENARKALIETNVKATLLCD